MSSVCRNFGLLFLVVGGLTLVTGCGSNLDPDENSLYYISDEDDEDAPSLGDHIAAWFSCDRAGIIAQRNASSEYSKARNRYHYWQDKVAEAEKSDASSRELSKFKSNLEKVKADFDEAKDKYKQSENFEDVWAKNSWLWIVLILEAGMIVILLRPDLWEGRVSPKTVHKVFWLAAVVSVVLLLSASIFTWKNLFGWILVIANLCVYYKAFLAKIDTEYFE